MLSMEQRCNICLMNEMHPKWTQLDLAKWAYEAFKLPSVPTQGSISRLIAKKHSYMNTKTHEKNITRLRKPKNPLLWKILQEWISQSIWNGIPVTIPILQVIAAEIWLRLPAKDREGHGTFSYKWLSKFLNKIGINLSSIEKNRTAYKPKVWNYDEKPQINQVLQGVDPEDIFTLDETYLAYNLPLDYKQYELGDIQSKIEVVTVMLCANVTGSEKIKPLIIGKYCNYHSFKNFFPNDDMDNTNVTSMGRKMAKLFGISYESNRKALLTSTLFYDWLVRWDKRLVAENRKIYLILDDSFSHRVVYDSLSCITLVYTSSTAKFLPFNWGILEDFKIRYRIEQYRALIDMQQKIEEKTKQKIVITFQQSELTMSNAFKFIKKAWEEISPEDIMASWKRSGLVPRDSIPLHKDISLGLKKNKHLYESLQLLCHQFYCQVKWDPDMLLDLYLENKPTKQPSTTDLINGAITEACEPVNKLLSKEDNTLNTFQVPKTSSNSNKRRKVANTTGSSIDNNEKLSSKKGDNIPVVTLESMYAFQSEDALSAIFEPGLQQGSFISNFIDRPNSFMDELGNMNFDDLLSFDSQKILKEGPEQPQQQLHEVNFDEPYLADLGNSMDNTSLRNSKKTLYSQQSTTHSSTAPFLTESLLPVERKTSNSALAASLQTVINNAMNNNIALSEECLNELISNYNLLKDNTGFNTSK